MGFRKIWGLEAAAADVETDTFIRPETPEQRRGNEYPISLLHAIQSRTSGQIQQEPGAREFTDTVCKSQSPENRAGWLRIGQEEEMYYGNNPFLFRSSCSQSLRSVDFKHCVIDTRLDYKPQYLT